MDADAGGAVEPVKPDSGGDFAVDPVKNQAASDVEAETMATDAADEEAPAAKAAGVPSSPSREPPSPAHPNNDPNVAVDAVATAGVPAAPMDTDIDHAIAAARHETAQHWAPRDPASRLNELEAFLRQPDAVMEPNIMEGLREYVLAGGRPQQAVEFLTDSYVGYAHQASLVCRWLRLAEDEGGGGIEAPGQPRVATAGGGGPSWQQRGVEGGAGGRVAERAELDEAYFLRELVEERFDPQLVKERFADIITAGKVAGCKELRWLDALIADRAGRQLIYDLSARYQHSLLLEFAVKKILQQPESEEEVAAAGGTLVGYFGVFHRLMAARLRQVAAAQDDAELERLGKELCEACCRSQHAYAHVQQVVTALASEPGPGAARCRRLSVELEAAAAAAAGPVAWKMQRWYAPAAHSPTAAAAAAAASDLLAAATSAGAAPSSDVLKLHRLYCPRTGNAPAPEDDAAPPVSLLRHPRLIEVLLHALFNPARQLQPDVQAAHIELLALAVAALEPGEGSGGALAGDDDRPAALGGAGGGGGGGGGLLGQRVVRETRAALEVAAEVGHKALREEQLDGEERGRVEAAVEQPCCAAGLLGMLRSRLTSRDYWTTAYHVHKEPPFLALLAAVVARQPGMHSDVIALLADALAALGDAASGPDVARGLVDVALRLLRAGRVEEVLAWGERWARNCADSGLVRHFVFGVLQSAAPPYSEAFASAVLRLMAAGGMRRQRLGAREWAARAPLLAEFAAGCAAVKFSPPLPQAEAAFLREALQQELRRSGSAARH